MVKKMRLDEAVNNWKRAVADYQNLEKRVLGERANWIRLANKELILRLLPVLDTLILIQKHVQDEGFTLSVKQFSNVLQEEGVKHLEVEGKKFDPRTMECVDMGQGEEGKVIEELQAGYMLHDVVLRPAKVKVGKGGNN